MNTDDANELFLRVINNAKTLIALETLYNPEFAQEKKEDIEELNRLYDEIKGYSDI